MRSLLNQKRGQARGMPFHKSPVFWILIILVVIVFLFASIRWMVKSSPFERIGGELDIGGKSAEITSFGNEEVFGTGFGFLDFIFGKVPLFLINVSGGTGAAIIVIAMWLLIWFTFGDIIASFSTFSNWVSWASACLIAIIAANLKGIVYILAFVIGIFAFLGTLAVIAGLVAAFVAFIGVNWGIKGLGSWLMERKLLMVAHKAAVKTEAGGEKLAGTIRGLRRVGEAIREET